MNRTLLRISLVCICLGGFASRAEPITIGFEPIVGETSGEALGIDLLVLDLGNFMHPSLGAFDLTLGFDPAILSLVQTSFGPFLGNPDTGEAFLSAAAIGPGAVSLVGLSLLSSAQLNALQPDAYTLATLTFGAVALGETPLLLTVNALSNELGESFSFVKTETGTARVIPEPATLLLVGIGLSGIAAVQRRRREARK